MRTHQHEDVGAWLEAERAGRDADADRRFRAVARALPRLDPPARFAEAVLARVAGVRAVPDIWSRWWVRVAVAAAVLAAGATAAALTPQGWFEAVLDACQTVAVAGGRAVSAAQAWVAGALAIWGVLGHAVTVVARQFSGPAPLLLVLFNFLMAGGAFAALRRLVPTQEN